MLKSIVLFIGKGDKEGIGAKMHFNICMQGGLREFIVF